MAAIAAPVDFQLEGMYPLRGIAMTLDHVTARIGLVQGDGPTDGPRNSRRLVGNPLRRASAMAVADDQLGLAAPWRHGMAVEEECGSVRR